MKSMQGVGLYSQVSGQQGQQLVQRYAGLVKRIALHTAARLPASVQLDDLIQAGMIGLLEAARKYDASKGATFETYATIRIRGSIVDEIRKGDWVPRSVHRNSRRIADAIQQIEAKHGRDAKDHEIAEVLSLSIDDYYAMLSDLSGSRLFSFEELMDAGDAPQESIASEHTSDKPPDELQQKKLRQDLARAIQTLPEREQLVLALYYDEELNLKEIGQVLGVSESRVSQIHSQAAMRLRARLADWHPE
ncbi:RNA polymerase sigma factor FliA [Zooshikella sp. RANM57]|uniref:RNA polymerase sigma factor FliA n=1 Tax=Zooshikella sp. RANM57 TaxID=3425863 RepID=UPI003D6EF8AD